MAIGSLNLNGTGVKVTPDKPTVQESGVVMQMPVRIGYRGNMWLLPIEPIVAVRGRNIITRRNIAKKKGIGSVKEVWSTDDYEVIITGTFEDDSEQELPSESISRLNALYRENKSVIIECALLDAVGVGMIAIESIEFPPTKGIHRQDFVIRGFSDEEHELF